MRNKRGNENLALPVIVFFVLVVAFFSIMILFVHRVAVSASVYEEIYSKKIALIIDEARPGSVLTLDISKIVSLARKNGFSEIQIKNKIITIDNNLVKVQLDSSGSYGFEYFSDYPVSYVIDGDVLILEVSQ